MANKLNKLVVDGIRIHTRKTIFIYICMYINIYESKQFLENILFSIICVLLFIYMYTNPNRHAFLFFVFVYRYLLTLVYILLSCNFNCFSFIFTKIEFVVLNQAGNNFCYSSIKRHALRSPPRYIITI